MILKTQQVPPNIHLNNPNPKIEWDKYSLKVVTEETIPIETDIDGPIFGCVNSFGFGGSNVHAILRSAPEASMNQRDAGVDDGLARLFCLSGHSEAALKDYAKRYLDVLHDESSTNLTLSDLCYTAGARRSHHDIRLTSAPSSKDELKEQLQAYLNGEKYKNMNSGRISNNKNHKVAFVFSGQGPQWYGMGKELFETHPVYRDAMLNVDAEMKKLAGWSIVEELSKTSEESRIHETTVAQPCIFALQVAMAHTWLSYGVQPDGIVGHSIGEVAAAHMSGALSLQDATATIYHRSRLQASTAGKGRMLAIGLPQDEVEREIRGWEDKVQVATVNSPKLTVIAGDIDAILRFNEEFEKRGIFNRLVRVDSAFHSHHMEPVKDELLSELAFLTPQETSVNLYSTVSGDEIHGATLDNYYWYRNVREPVLFTKATNSMIRDGYNVFVEIAPHPILFGGVEEMLKNANKSGKVVNSVRRKEPELSSLIGALGSLHGWGVKMSWDMIFPQGNMVDLPQYPFQKEYCWNESQVSQNRRLGLDECKSRHPLLGQSSNSALKQDDFSWEVKLDNRKEKYIEDHRVQGPIIFPAAGYVEIALASAMQSFGDRFDFLENLNFEAALFLPEKGDPSKVQLDVCNADGYYSLQLQSGDAWAQCSDGHMNHVGDSFVPIPVNFKEVKAAAMNHTEHDANEFYATLKTADLVMGPAFRSIKRFFGCPKYSFAEIEAHESIRNDYSFYNLHPAILDACVQSIFGAAECANKSKKPLGAYLPVHIDRVKFYQKTGSYRVFCCGELLSLTSERMIGNFWVFNENEELVAEFQGFHYKYLKGSRQENNHNRDEWFYEYQWQQLDVGEPLQDDATEKKQDGGLFLLFHNNEDGDVSKQLIEEITARGDGVISVTEGSGFKCRRAFAEYSINPSNQEDINEVVQLCKSLKDNFRGIINMWDIDKSHQGDGAPHFDTFEDKTSLFLLELLRQADKVSSFKQTLRLWIITRGYDIVSSNNDVCMDLAASSVWGLGRVIMTEMSDYSTTLVDLSCNQPSTEEVALLANELYNKTNYEEIALRGEERYIHKMKRLTVDEMNNQAARNVRSQGTSFALDSDLAATNDYKYRFGLRKQNLSDGEIEIAVKACGLSLRDFNQLKESNTDKKSEEKAGVEVSGSVIRVGPGVKNLALGDEVYGISSSVDISGLTVGKANQFLKKPLGMTSEEAASLPIALITANYGLNYLGRMTAGDWVLINVDANLGVGSTAVKVAQQKGANVILSIQGDCHNAKQVANSLNVDYLIAGNLLASSNKVMEITGGRGVDIVMNTASGDLAYQAMKCLAPFGRFLNVGNKDLSSVSISKDSVKKSIAYYSLNVDDLIELQPALSARLLAEAAPALNEDLSPLINIYAVSDTSAAMKSVSITGVSSEKVVLKMQDENLDVLPSTDFTHHIEDNATYLVTGGLAGFGLACAKWLVSVGAKYLALMSRSGLSRPAAQMAVAELEELGVKVFVLQGDVSKKSDVERCFNELNASNAPTLKGVIHSAAVIKDFKLLDINEERHLQVLNPKIRGCWNLHEATKDLDLKFFVLYSSVSAQFGNEGQGSYSAANTFLDQFSRYRRSIGLTSTTINWGVLGEVGHVSQNKSVEKLLSAQGWRNMSVEDSTWVLGKMITDSPACRMAADADWTKMPSFKRFSRFEALYESSGDDEENQADGFNMIEEALGESDEKALDIIQGVLKEGLADLIGVPAANVDIQNPVTNMGLDSIIANLFRGFIQNSTNIKVSMMEIMSGPSIVDLSNQILEGLKNRGSGEDGEKESNENNIKKYITSFKPIENPKARLFCFPYIMGSAIAFKPWADTSALDSNVEVLAIELPGRGFREEESLITDKDELFKQLAVAMEPYLDVPFAFYGHSFGCMYASGFIKYLAENSDKAPVAFFPTAFPGPNLEEMKNFMGDVYELIVDEKSIKNEELNETMVEFLQKLKVPEVLLKNRKLVDSAKVDLLIGKNLYSDVEGHKFKCPIVAFAGRGDDVFVPEQVAQWEHSTSNEFLFVEVDAISGHIFIDENRDNILSEIMHHFY